jgi:two-component system sensor histidine kinase UhpB
MSLFVRVFVTNAALLGAATLALGLSPVTVSWPIAVTEALVLAVGLVAMLVANALLLRPAFTPLRRLAGHMRDVDLLRPGHRVPAQGPVEVTALVRAFNEMLERLEGERRDSGRRAVAAQEAERKRIAIELHDEVGQTMTAVLMRLERLRDAVPPARTDELDDAREAVRSSLDDARRIAQELRPEMLETLGLVSALTALCRSFSARTGIRVDCGFPPDPPVLDAEAELAVYRVAQEALTNVARHSGARHAWLRVDTDGGGVALTVADDGRGFGGTPSATGGLHGMRERAVTVGGTLTIDAAPASGVAVRLELAGRQGSP